MAIGGDVSCERFCEWCIYLPSLTHSLGRGVFRCWFVYSTPPLSTPHLSMHFNIQNLHTTHIVIHSLIPLSVHPPLSSQLKFLHYPSRPSISPSPSYALTTITSHLHLHLGRRGTAQHSTGPAFCLALSLPASQLGLLYLELKYRLRFSRHGTSQSW